MRAPRARGATPQNLVVGRLLPLSGTDMRWRAAVTLALGASRCDAVYVSTAMTGFRARPALAVMQAAGGSTPEELLLEAIGFLKANEMERARSNVEAARRLCAVPRTFRPPSHRSAGPTAASAPPALGRERGPELSSSNAPAHGATPEHHQAKSPRPMPTATPLHPPTAPGGHFLHNASHEDEPCEQSLVLDTVGE